jgi:hypothetical protein
MAEDNEDGVPKDVVLLKFGHRQQFRVRYNGGEH